MHSMVLIYWNMKLMKSYSLEWFINIYLGCNLWFNKFTLLEDEIHPQE